MCIRDRNGRQAIRSLDMRVFMLIGAAFAMGGSLQATGGAGYLANVVVDIFAPYGSAVLIPPCSCWSPS